MKKSIGLLILAIGRLLFFLFLICICKSDNAQGNNGNDSLNLKLRIYKANILSFSKKEYTKGYLANLSDSALQLSSSPVYFSASNTKNNFSAAYNYDQLKKVIIIRKGAVGRGVGYGALIGLGAGVITGLTGTSGESSSDYFLFSPGQEVAFTGILGAVAGALIGAIIGGLAHQTFIINENKNQYDSMRESIFSKLFRHHSSRNKYQKSHVPDI